MIDGDIVSISNKYSEYIGKVIVKEYGVYIQVHKGAGGTVMYTPWADTIIRTNHTDDINQYALEVLKYG